MAGPPPASRRRSGERAPSPPASTSASHSKRRVSSAGRLINNFFRRLIPFPQSSSSSSSHSSQSVGTSTTDTNTPPNDKPPAQGDGQRIPEESETMAPGAMPAPARARKENSLPTAVESGEATAKVSTEMNDSPQKLGAPMPVRLSTEKLETSDKTVKAKPNHQIFMDQALDMARLALRTNETPVGCVLVRNNTVVAKGMNATNVTRNGTRHAEFMAISALLSRRSEDATSDDSVAEPRHVPSACSPEVAAQREREKDADLGPDPSLNDPEYVKRGHLYPYGQKLHREPNVSRSIVGECVLYVTVEPCVMCAGLLRQLGIQKVYFGAVNDKFGGAGGVFSIHLNSIRPQEWERKMVEEKEAQNQPLGALTNGQQQQHQRRPGSSGSQGVEKPPQKMTNGQYHQPLSNPDGDGGNVEAGFEIEGGWGRDEAVGLLRRFYVQENGRAPQPRKKEGRAARLAALEQGGNPDTPSEGGGELMTGGTPGETGAGNAAAEASKTAIEAEIEEIPVQGGVVEGSSATRTA